jgi:hypothetical protein
MVSTRRMTNLGPSAAGNLGFCSLFVLAKIGFDMREQYNYLLQEPFPEDINRPLQVLMGKVYRLPAKSE